MISPAANPKILAKFLRICNPVVSCLCEPFLLHFQKLDPEIEFLARHLVVGIQCNGRVVLGSDSDREGLACITPEHDPVAYAQILGARELCDLDRDDRFGIRIAVCLFRRQVDIDDLADFHLRHCLVKSQDHHASSADKRERLAAVIGGIELCSVVKGPSVVDADALSGVPAIYGIAAASTTTAAALVVAVIVAVAAAALVIIIVAEPVMKSDRSM